MQLRHYLTEYWYVVVLGLIIFLSFGFRVYNLNYNSPFNDEAIYVVLGRYGVFQGDWWTYNASSWMAGQPYIYPPLTATAYMVKGIVGSRFLNVIFGALIVESVYAMAFLISENIEADDRKNKNAGLIAAIVVAASSVGYFLARLATYDLPSFYMFVLSLVFLLKAQFYGNNPGKWYFASSVMLFLAFMSKIVIAIYIPFVFIYSFYVAWKSSDDIFNFWKKYFAIPLFLLIGLYAYTNFPALSTYTQGQLVRDLSPASQIIKTYWENTHFVWWLWAVGSIGLFVRKQYALWFWLTAMALLILAFHIGLHRWPTLDKHTFLTTIFVAPIIGIGLSQLFRYAPKTSYQSLVSCVLIVLLALYVAGSSMDSIRFNDNWDNSDAVLDKLSELTNPGDRILAEVGAGAILVNYDKNYPIYTTTFDWFTYRDLQGEKAYLAAIKDGYFDLIELDGGDQTAELIHSKMHNLVLNNIKGNYERIYNDEGFLIYRRVF
jgi:hypothetical protein